EYGAKPSEVYRLAREGYRPTVENLISQCRSGHTNAARGLDQALRRLEYNLAEFNLSQDELTGWLRQAAITTVRSQLATSLRA
ncbi:MAG: hypothetical protein AAB037_03635, partial [Chloroflexota bacterium]